MKNYAREIKAAILTAIRTLTDELGLKTVEEGDFARVFAPDFADTMPMVQLATRQTDPPELGMSKMSVEYPLRIRVYRQQQQEVAENPYELTNAMADRIWEVVCTAPGITQNRPEWANSLPTKCQYQSTRAAIPTLDHTENMFLNEPTYRANCAWIDLLITAQSMPT